MGKIKDWIAEHKKLSIIGLVVLAVFIIFRQAMVVKEREEKQAETDRITQELLEQTQNSEDSDNLLMQMQPDLIASYGKLPEGFIWDSDGSLLSLGDKSLSAEDVVYRYFKGLSMLDMSVVQKYSRESTVVTNYSGYFDEKNKNGDYLDQFLRKMYKECLSSIQIVKVSDTATFAENKKVFTVQAKMLDLSDKDFWKKDEMTIYKNLKTYDSDEEDSAKSDTYLYDYIMSYYTSEDAKLRDISFDITVQRYPDLDSGWLVSIDTDIDDACRYKDGKLVVSYIREQYRNYGREMVTDSEESK